MLSLSNTSKLTSSFFAPKAIVNSSNITNIKMRSLHLTHFWSVHTTFQAVQRLQTRKWFLTLSLLLTITINRHVLPRHVHPPDLHTRTVLYIPANPITRESIDSSISTYPSSNPPQTFQRHSQHSNDFPYTVLYRSGPRVYPTPQVNLLSLFRIAVFIHSPESRPVPLRRHSPTSNASAQLTLTVEA